MDTKSIVSIIPHCLTSCSTLGPLRGVICFPSLHLNSFVIAHNVSLYFSTGMSTLFHVVMCSFIYNIQFLLLKTNSCCYPTFLLPSLTLFHALNIHIFQKFCCLMKQDIRTVDTNIFKQCLTLVVLKFVLVRQKLISLGFSLIGTV